MEHHHCLNCGTALIGAHCHQCGQKSNTHRLTMRHFIQHDLVHGIWHVDKGILLTLRHILTRPGYLARDYIAGKRTGHFNLVTLLVLLSTLFLLGHHIDPATSSLTINGRRAPDLVAFIAAYGKWLLLVSIPLLALATGQILKRLRYNTAERLVTCGYFMAGVLCFMLAFRLIFKIPGVLNGYSLLLAVLVILAYLGFAFMQVLKGVYSPGHRVALSLLVLAAFIGYLMCFIGGALTIYVQMMQKG